MCTGLPCCFVLRVIYCFEFYALCVIYYNVQIVMSMVLSFISFLQVSHMLVLIAVTNVVIFSITFFEL